MAFPIILPAVFASSEVGRLREIVDTLLPHDLTQADINSFDMLKALTRYGDRGRALMEEAFTLFCRSACLRAAQTILRGDVAFLYPQCAFRYHRPGDSHSHLPFHFDGSFLGQDVTSLNFWVPLVDVGTDAPGLTFLRPEVDPGIFVQDWMTSAIQGKPKRPMHEDVAELYGRPVEEVLFTPVMKAGSVAVFHQLTPHATQRIADGGKLRVSIEFRIAKQNALPELYRLRDHSVAVPRQRDGAWSFGYVSARTPEAALADP